MKRVACPCGPEDTLLRGPSYRWDRPIPLLDIHDLQKSIRCWLCGLVYDGPHGGIPELVAAAFRLGSLEGVRGLLAQGDPASHAALRRRAKYNPMWRTPGGAKVSMIVPGQ